MFTTYQIEQVISSDGNVYYLQYASFTNKDVMEENIKKLNNYVIQERDHKYYVYVGATTMLENANTLKKIFENAGIYTYIKNDYLSNNKIINEIIKIDKEIIKIDNENDILKNNNEILNLLK